MVEGYDMGKSIGLVEDVVGVEIFECVSEHSNPPNKCGFLFYLVMFLPPQILCLYYNVFILKSQHVFRNWRDFFLSPNPFLV